MNRLLKFFWLVSLVLYLVGLLLIYAFLPDRVGIQANEYGMPYEFVTREAFFYFSLITVIFANGLLYALNRLLLITRRSAQTDQSFALRTDLAAWLLGFAAALNIFFVFAMAFFGLFNSTENYDTNRFLLLVYGGPLLMALMFGLLAYILIKRKSQITS